MTDYVEKTADLPTVAQHDKKDGTAKQKVTHVITVSDAEAMRAYKKRAAAHKAAYDALKSL